MAVHQRLENSKLGRLVTRGIQAALLVFQVARICRRPATNATLLGWDVPSHLGTSLIDDSILHRFSLKMVFARTSPKVGETGALATDGRGLGDRIWLGWITVPAP